MHETKDFVPFSLLFCKIHGDFKQSPHEHMKGQGCPMCAISNCSKSKTTNVNVLIEKSIEKFGDKFSYEKTIETYKNVKSECIIHCNICNIDFKTSFYKHFRNKLGDCPKCKEKKQIKIDNKKKLHKIETEEKHNKKIQEKENRILYERLRKEEIILKKEELRKNREILKLEKKNEYQYKHTKEYLRTVFLNKAISKYGDRYDFSNIKEYVNSNTPVPVICHEKDEFGDEHGVFMIRPYSLIAGHGCPKCSKKHKYTEDELLKKFIHIHGNKYDYGDLSNKKK